VVSAGGTREAIDPVRFVGNFSSGKMGRALAEVAAARGAEVTLVTTVPTDLEGVHEIAVTSGKEMLAALQAAVGEADILLMAAAVADYAPETVAPSKLHRSKEPLSLTLHPNVDVLQQLAPRDGLFRVGFAAETEDLASRARQKLDRKGLDMIVANQVGSPEQGLGSDYNAVTIMSARASVEVARASKWEVAERIWDAIDAARHPQS
jgi:phosphopantothenoylcysteine decarboxylase/phosphopantothenate--cysteine ligase